VIDDDVLHQRLAALGAVIADRAEDVQLRHVAHRAAAGEVVEQRPVTADAARRAVLRETRDVNEVVFLQVAVPHVVAVHEDERPQVLDAPVAVVVGIGNSERCGPCQEIATLKGNHGTSELRGQSGKISDKNHAFSEMKLSVRGIFVQVPWHFLLERPGFSG